MLCSCDLCPMSDSMFDDDTEKKKKKKKKEKEKKSVLWVDSPWLIFDYDQKCWHFNHYTDFSVTDSRFTMTWFPIHDEPDLWSKMLTLQWLHMVVRRLHRDSFLIRYDLISDIRWTDSIWWWNFCVREFVWVIVLQSLSVMCVSHSISLCNPFSTSLCNPFSVSVSHNLLSLDLSLLLSTIYMHIMSSPPLYYAFYEKQKRWG